MILCPFADTAVTTNEIKIDKNHANAVLCPRLNNVVSEPPPSSKSFFANG